MKKLKEKWNITSNLQLLVILIVFAITGSLALWISKPLLTLLSIKKDLLSVWIFWPARIIIIFTTYQILILLIGGIFGQFKFFWEFEKKFLIRLGFKKLKNKN